MTRGRILEIGGYPPPRGGWTMRIEWLKKQLEIDGHECVVLNIGPNRMVPSPYYETVAGGWDFLAKVFRYSRRGFVAHTHVNGESPKGLLLALAAQAVNRVCGRRPVVTFHAGTRQTLFPRARAPHLVPLFWMVFGTARRVICNSSAVKAMIVEYGVHPEKVLPIPAFTRQYLDFCPAKLTPALEQFLKRWDTPVFCYTRMLPTYYPDVLLEGFARVAARRAGACLILLGVSEDRDEALSLQWQRRVADLGLADRIFEVAGDDHDLFVTVMTRCRIYLRTHIADGVASSVLEALTLGVPVVACDNGTRPPGVVTFAADSSADLARKMEDTLDRRDEIAATMSRPAIGDTLADEIAVLAGTR
jgi:glycosyltransferase involved in cell wall biosynthesis